MIEAIGILVTASLFIVSWLIYKAPIAYEDETGFHLGEKDV